MREPAIKTDQGVCRPDCIAYRLGDSAIVITIVSDVLAELSADHAWKIRKYDEPAIRTWISGLAGISEFEVSFSSPTFNRRGALCKESANDMKAFGIPMSTMEIMATRLLEWGHCLAGIPRCNLDPDGRNSKRFSEHSGGSRARLQCRSSAPRCTAPTVLCWPTGNRVTRSPRPEDGGG